MTGVYGRGYFLVFGFFIFFLFVSEYFHLISKLLFICMVLSLGLTIANNSSEWTWVSG